MLAISVLAHGAVFVLLARVTLRAREVSSTTGHLAASRIDLVEDRTIEVVMLDPPSTPATTAATTTGEPSAPPRAGPALIHSA